MGDNNGTASDGIKYPWQQHVLEAFVASSESLPAKINVAERAIAGRLKERPEPDPEESLALHDALRAMHILIEETRKLRQEEPEEELPNHGHFGSKIFDLTSARPKKNGSSSF